MSSMPQAKGNKKQTQLLLLHALLLPSLPGSATSAAQKGNSSNPVIGHDLPDSSSLIKDDSISIPDANSLDDDIAHLLADQQQNDTTQQNETSEEVVVSIETELLLTEDKGADINPKLANITNNLLSEKLQDDKVKENLKSTLFPATVTTLLLPNVTQRYGEP